MTIDAASILETVDADVAKLSATLTAFKSLIPDGDEIAPVVADVAAGLDLLAGLVQKKRTPAATAVLAADAAFQAGLAADFDPTTGARK